MSQTNASVYKGILTVCIGIAMLTSMDFFAKILRDSHDTMELVFYRAAVGLPLLIGLAAATGQLRQSLTFKYPHIHIGRSVCMGLGLSAFIYALDGEDVATLTSVAFITPMVATILAIPLLGEKVHWHRWTAIIVGFGGVLLIVRPEGGEFSIPVLMVLGSTVLWALGIIITRKAPDDLNSQSIAINFMVCLLLGTAIPTFIGWEAPTMAELPYIFGLGLSGALGQIFLVYGYRWAPVSTASPFEYTALIWAVLGDFLLFSALPSLSVWMGAAIIAGSGLYIAYREHVRDSELHATKRRQP